MTLLHIIRSSILATLFAGAAPAALAAAAVAVGDGNYTYTVTDDVSVKAAEVSALEECARRAAHCEVLISTARPAAIALAKGKGGLSVFIDPVPEQARKKALADCGKKYKACKFSALYWEPGGNWAAWAHAKDENGELAATYFNYNAASLAEASAVALERCNKQLAGKSGKCEVQGHFGDWAYVRAGSASYTSVWLNITLEAAIADAMAACKAGSKPGDTCKVIDQAFNGGKRNPPASFDKVASLTELAREARTPASQVRTQAVQELTCTNRCVNGSCVRTFPNGRTEKWQAPRVYDPFTNDWKWETSSCGG